MKQIIFVICCIAFLAQGGRILNGDVKVDYANAGYMTQLSFSFMLSNSIINSDFIKIALPFPFQSQLIPAFPATEGLSSPLGLLVTYQTIDNNNNVQATTYYARVLTDTIDSSNYFVQFYASDRKTIIDIPANQWYYLTMKIQTAAPLAYQTSNSVLQIQMSTVSSVWPNAMVYDDNLAFNYFQLSASPSQLISVSTTPISFGAAGGYLLIQKQYSMHIDVVLNIPNYYYNQNLLLKFIISKENTFAFRSTCSSVEKTNSPKINMLGSTHYTCSVDTATNIMTVNLKPSGLAIQQSFRFLVGMRNPTVVAQGVDILVYAMQQNSPIILGLGKATGVLNTNQLYVTYQQIFLGWGLRSDALLPFDARVYRGNSASPTYLPYNSLSLKFSISSTTASTVQLKVVIKIPSQASAFVLPSGFSTNLPAFPNKQVVCVTEFSTSETNRQIGCTGVGALTAGTVYYVGWKMFFPYDNYQSSINCNQFGLLTIYTTTTITATSFAYYLGRGDSYLNYLKASADFVVIGRNSSFINYMTTFPSINLVVLSSDFQQFLSQPESLYMNNRPASYLSQTFNNLYVIRQNLAFLTYMNLFTDIYCAVLIPKNTDIVNGYDTLPLVATTAPKNTLTITTSNSNDWADFTGGNLNPLVSTVAAATTNTPGTALFVNNSPQSLVFSFKASYAQVTQTSSTANTAIPNNWGMLIMANPSIKLDNSTGLTIKQSITTSLLTPSVTTVDSNSSYNKYTLITLRGNNSNALLTSFNVAATKTAFGLHPFIVNTFSSIYADSSNMDFMIMTYDGIDGPANKVVQQGYFLINAFSQTASPLGTLNYGFMNYQQASPLDGSRIPTMLRLKGTLAIPAGSVLDSLTVFFDSMTPFFSNQHAGQIYCYNSDNNLPCKYYKGSLLSTGKQLYNINSLSRFQVSISAPASAFNILIPMVHTTAQTNINIYLAYQIRNTNNGFKNVAYVEARTLSSITAGNAGTSGTYGPLVTSTSITVGQSVTNLVINARSGAAVTANTNANSNIGAGFSYFSEWDYFRTSTVSGWTAGTCSRLKYLFYYTNYAAYLTGATFASTYKQMTGVVCNCDTSGVITGATITLSTGYLPSKWGIQIPGSSGISQNVGHLVYLKDNADLVGGTLSLTALTFPTVGPNMVKAVGEWAFNLPVGLESNVIIKISTLSGSINLPFTFSGTCATYYNSMKVAAGCNFITTPTSIHYILTILQSGLIPAGPGFKIVHYGMQSNTVNADVVVNIICQSLLRTNTPSSNDRIFSALNQNFVYQPASYVGRSSLSLGQFVQWTQDKAVAEKFSFSFALTSKGLYVTNRVRLNLGQFALDNSASVLSPRCKALVYNPAGSTQFSHDWAAIDVSGGLSNLQLWPTKNLINDNLKYTIECQNFISTSSPTPTAITAKVVNTSSDLTGELDQNTTIVLPVLDLVSTTAQITLSKLFSIPSVGMEMNFNVISPGVSLDSYLYINFPSYYASNLGQDIKCYSPSGQIYCSVDNRLMTLQYIGTYAVGTSFTITVTGVTMPINYNSGTFSFVFDDDNNPLSVQAAGTFTDTISSTVLSIQNFPTINIFAYTKSSNYLRQNGITLSLTFYLSTALSSVGLGQSLFLVFPATYFDVLRFVSPSCTLNILGNTLKNYVSTCSILGMRIKMPFLDTLVLGSTYTLTVGGLINPTNPSSNIYKYSLQITDSTATSIIAKSYATNCNFNMPTFSHNSITNVLNYYSASGAILTSLNTMANIQSSQIYISPQNNLLTATYSRNTYLSPLSNLYSNPSNINLLAGANPFSIRLSSLTSGVNYLYFSKSGDGGYYSNLPPLILTTSKNYFTAASFVQTSFKLPVGLINSNYTLYVTLPPNLYPISQVTFTVTLTSAVGISLTNNPTTISFFPGKIVANIELYISDATLWVVGATTNLTFTPSAGSTTYASGVSLVLNAVAASSTPVLTFTTGTINLMSMQFSVMCSEQGKFIYHLYRDFTFNTTACYLNQTDINYWLGQSSLSSLRVSQNYYKCKDIIAIENIAANVTKTITISGLEAKTNYKIDGFCQSQSGVRSPITNLTASTLTNGGQYSSMVFRFSGPLTTAQKIKLVCALALKFQIDYEKVSTYDGYFCSELLNRRRLLHEQSSGVVHRRNLQSSTTDVRVFFGINSNSNNDASLTAIQAQANTSALITSLNANIAGLPTLLSTSANTLVTHGPNEFTSIANLGIGPNYIFIHRATLTTNGLIYVIVGDNAVWTRQPTISEIKTGSGPGGLNPVCFKVLVYETTNPDSGNIVCSNIVGSGSYTLYAVASDNNPFDTANFGTIRKSIINKQTPSFQKYMTLLIIAILMLLLG